MKERRVSADSSFPLEIPKHPIDCALAAGGYRLLGTTGYWLPATGYSLSSLHCLQKNHAAMPRPITTTSARNTGCGTRFAMLAEEYPPMAAAIIAATQ